ncbi:MAG TPA: DinB family protein [Pyrinomonadaceae bacterium]|nr:DinB family protein [Pyrinomonadaceae bacterium]
MNFDILRSVEVLSATPAALRVLLGDLSEEWVSRTTIAESTAGNAQPAVENAPWQPFDIVGHLLHGELTDWIPRARIILASDGDRTFVPFDRFAQFETSEGKSLAQLLGEFERLRAENIEVLRSWNLTIEQLDLEGIHPELGRVTLKQLLATWVVHDLNHIAQIATALARRYDAEVGPWKEYLSILKS